MQEKAFNDRRGTFYLSGGQVIDGYSTPYIRGENISGLGQISIEDIVQLLKTGRNKHNASFGSMSDVVKNSTQYMTKSDLTAIAEYLKSLEPHVKETKAYYDSSTFTALSQGIFSRRVLMFI